MKTKVETVKSKGVLADYVKKADTALYNHLKNRSLIAMKISKALKEAGLSKKEFAQKNGEKSYCDNGMVVWTKKFHLRHFNRHKYRVRHKLLTKNKKYQRVEGRGEIV